MKRSFTVIAFILFMSGLLPAQDSTATRDTIGMLPRLEIPEITIVGKKAIMLPFARKGEVYDVDVYDAPGPDTLLLGRRKTMSLPVGSLPRYEEQLMPWRASLEGGLGNYTTGHLFGYVDYTALRWGISGKGGYMTTSGHTDNADGNSTQLELTARSLVATDNDLLKDFRTDGGISYHHENYGMYGITSSIVRRTRNTVGLLGMLGSANREGPVLDLSLGANITNITDASAAGDSEVSIVSPTLHASFSTDMSSSRFVGDLLYKSSSLNYQQSVQSPSLIGLSLGARWFMTDQLRVTLGGFYQHGSDSQGGDHSMVAPTVDVTWERDKDRVWSFWYRPEIRLMGYDELSLKDPYLVREMVIKPERDPLNIGSTLMYNSEHVSIRFEGSYSHTNDKMVEIADSGRIRLAYLDADQFLFSALGTVSLANQLSLHVQAEVQPARGENTSIQLPMLPIAHIDGRLQYDMCVPFTVWSELEYTSKRNVDLGGDKTLNDAVLLHAGVSTHALPRTSLSFQIKNIFNTAFQWWDGYSAAGRQIMVEAKIDLQ
jgi:hypothetical protein